MAIAAEDWINEQKRNFFKFTGRERPSDDAVFILVMGMTGSGKSTFIAQATGKDVTVGHGLSSCTSGISIYNGKVDGRSVYLIDTPGFDDTHVSDFDTLQTLATYLSISYHRNVYVHGIVLLHSIASSRITGSARRAIAMFQALCGPTTNSNVALATTFWASSSEPRSLLKAREGQLVSDESFFGPIAAGGARAFRHAEHGLPSGPASARRIVSHLIKQARVAPVVLDIQHELVNKRLRLDQTAAGRIALGAAATVVSATKHRIEDIRAELCRASQRNDSDTVGALMEVKLDLDQRLADVAAANRKLALNMQEMAALEQSLLVGSPYPPTLETGNESR
ncbi:hypothetical protein CkaCkLH20_12957 [Colletotrichum karsti]|uniref:G domain-containing protein n=1 Tax=Colletotrichum karsti TaxID=1095194 RepID=A0A9P6LCS7_9PEZI|nr:uncharacterized protein CkaCkLH20_12957 [Colletotrichum karsti]KAF9869564.1 hypothetical protein CkaCkLH20_12957 [Colletotrichum karsti]